MQDALDHQNYTLSLVSDTHFDEEPWERYRLGLETSPESLAWRNYTRNIRMWETLEPSLLTASAAVADDADFVLHLGDVAQGDAASPEALIRMLDKGYRRVTAAYGNRPVYLLAGNHDVRAPGGVEAYLAWSRRPLNRCFRKGSDAWILVDTDHPPTLKELKSLFRQTEGARWTFFLSHRPVLPCNAGSVYSFLYDDPEHTDCRLELRRLLASRQAIVLSAHVHGLYQSSFDFPEGRVTQFVINSLWEKPELSAVEFRTVGQAKWCSKLNGIPEKDRAAFAALADEYRPHLASHRQVHAAGHFKLHVSDERVTLDVFGGDARTPSETVTLAEGPSNQKRARPAKARILRKIADFLLRGLRIPRKTTST